MITSFCANIIQNYYKKTQAVSAARHLKKVNDAACAYLKDNFTQFKTDTEEIFTIELQRLIDQGYLTNGFFKKNVYSQEYRIQIRVPTEQQKDWQILTTTEKGDQIDPHAWTVIGSLLKHRGFYRSKSTKKIINGLRQPSNSSITEIVDSGHIAFLQVIDNIRLYATDSFIYRKINDNDSPRLMQTSLRLDKNSIIFKKNPIEIKLNNQSLELKNKVKNETYTANLELLNKEKKNIPTLRLEESDLSDSKCLTINSPSLKIHRNPLFSRISCRYDSKKKEATLLFIRHTDQLHWSAYWNHIPYHQGNFKTAKEILQSAKEICHYDTDGSSQISIGRLFAIHSIQKIQIFVCRKNKDDENIIAHELLTLPQFSKGIQSPQQKIYLGKKIKGFSLRQTEKYDSQLIEFLRDKIKLIYILSYLEEKFYSAKNNKSTNIRGLTKSLNDLHKEIEDQKKEILIKKLSKIIREDNQPSIIKIMSPEDIAKKFIEYKKNTKEYMLQDIKLLHTTTLKSILADLNDVLNSNKSLSVKDFFSKERTKTYFNNLKNCPKLYTTWLPTMYVFSTSISLANPDNDHPFFETIYLEG